MPVLSEQVAGSAQESGLVHEAVLRRIPGLAGYDIYAAGPPAMIDAVRAALPRQGADPARIYFDSFDYAPA
jgi:CDP-4-dehydro-6-deoxyglucose reductase